MINLLKKSTPLNLNKIRSSGLTTFLNPVSYLKARKYFKTYNSFNYLLADGWFFVAILKLIGIKTRRYSFDMTSLAPVVFNKAIDQNQSIYFLGAKSDEISNFIDIIKKHFPNLNIIGYRNGYFKDSEERSAVIRNIKHVSPDIAIVGLGVPLQEKFLVDLQEAGWKGCGYTCGGFIHQTSQSLHYYPSWVNRFNLRMPYRIVKEPHFRKRIPDYFKFIFIFFYDYWKYKKGINLNL